MLSDVLKKIRDLRTRLIHTDALTHAATFELPEWSYQELGGRLPHPGATPGPALGRARSS